MQTLFHSGSPEDLENITFEVEGVCYRVAREDLTLLEPDSLEEKALRAVVLESSLRWTGQTYQNAVGLPVYLWFVDKLVFVIALGEQTSGSFRAVLEGHFVEENAAGYFPRDAHGLAPAYRILQTVAEPKIQGAWPQIKGFATVRPVDPAYARKHREFLPADLEMNDFEFAAKLIWTDFFSACVLKSSGFFVAPRIEELLQDFDLGPHQFVVSTVYHNKTPKTIFFLQILDCDSLDYEKSRFLVNDRQDGESVLIQGENLEQLYEKRKELMSSPARPSLTPSSLVLTGAPDLFRPPLSTDVLVSARLREAFRAEKVTGVEYGAVEDYSIVLPGGCCGI